MTTATRTTAHVTATAPHRIGMTALIDLLVKADRRHRYAKKLREMPDVRLRDMGLTRAEANSAFRTGRW